VKFPGSREFSREFREKPGFGGPERRENQGTINSLQSNSLRHRAGNFSPPAGNSVAGAGISAAPATQIGCAGHQSLPAVAGFSRKNSMSRTTPKLPIARGFAVPTLHITEVDWKRIESAYGHALGDALRRDVLEVTGEVSRLGRPRSDCSNACRCDQPGSGYTPGDPAAPQNRLRD
jgi:hypothetical protein